MSVEVRTAGGIAEVVIDFPPVNALPVQGWYDLAAAISAAGADGSTTGGDPGRGGSRLLRRGGHQGDAAQAGARGPARRQPGLRGCVCRGIRLPGAGDRRGARLLPGRRRRPGRQRGHRDRRRGRDVRAARGRPGRAGRGHAPGPAGAAAADARHGLHLPDRHRAAAARLRHRARRGPARGAEERGQAAGGGDRGQGPGGDPAGQAVAERHQPGRRQAVLPVRAGVHLRAEPGQRRRPGPPGLRGRAASGREASGGEASA